MNTTGQKEAVRSSLEALRSQFEDGTITKPIYTRRMWQTHQQLFDYAEFLHGTNVAAIEIRDEGVVIRLRDPDLQLWCTPEDQRHVAIANLNFRNYESTELKAVLRLARACTTIFDIGANVGFYSIALALQFSDADIHAFEPIPATFQELERNLILNRIANVTSHNIGLSDREYDAPFFFDPTVSGAASGAPLGTEFGPTKSLTCPVETIDAFVARTGTSPGFIKCDVEGGELLVFRGASETLKVHKPIVFTEMLRKWSARFNYHPNDIMALFADLNSQCFALREGTLHLVPRMTDETTETNFFFLHAERHLEMVRFPGLLS